MFDWWRTGEGGGLQSSSVPQTMSIAISQQSLDDSMKAADTEKIKDLLLPDPNDGNKSTDMGLEKQETRNKTERVKPRFTIGNQAENGKESPLRKVTSAGEPASEIDATDISASSNLEHLDPRENVVVLEHHNQTEMLETLPISTGENPEKGKGYVQRDSSESGSSCEVLSAKVSQMDTPSTPAMRKKVGNFLKKHFPERDTQRAEPSLKLRGILAGLEPHHNSQDQTQTDDLIHTEVNISQRKKSTHLFENLLHIDSHFHHTNDEHPESEKHSKMHYLFENLMHHSNDQKRGGFVGNLLNLSIRSKSQNGSEKLETSVEKIEGSIDNVKVCLSPTHARSEDHLGEPKEMQYPVEEKRDESIVHEEGSHESWFPKIFHTAKDSAGSSEGGERSNVQKSASLSEKYGKVDGIIGQGAFAKVKLVRSFALK